MPAVDPGEFRNALGQFATGVTIVTSLNEQGKFIGLTANSFNSASLNPPLVLWSLAKSSKNLHSFKKAEHFAVHILNSDQVDLSRRFASSVDDRFKDLQLETGIGNLPLIKNCCARFQCKNTYQYEGGDHIIFVGEVLEFESGKGQPLAFLSGKYASVSTLETGSGQDILDYDRCYHLINLPFRKGVSDIQLSASEAKVLNFLSNRPLTFSSGEIRELAAVLDEPLEKVINGLSERQLVKTDADSSLALTRQGEELIGPMLARVKAYEENILAGFPPEERVGLLSLLRSLASSVPVR